MTSLSKRSVMHIVGVTMMLITTLTPPMTATESSPSASPAISSPGSVLFHYPIEKKKQQQQQQLGGDEEREIGCQLQQDVKANFQADCGVWNPTPRSDGAYASPIPHAEDVRYGTSLPSSNPFSHSKSTEAFSSISLN